MPDETNSPAILTLPKAEIQPPSTDRQPFEIVRAPRVVADTGTAALAPQTAAQFAGRSAGARGLTSSFEERNVVPGIPLDVETGLTTWDRLQLARRGAEQDQFAYLKNKYGDAVRRSDTGEWIVRVPDEATGGQKDIVANPNKITLSDMGSLMGHAPEVAMWVAGEKGLRTVPMLNKMRGIRGAIRDVIGGAAAMETGLGLQDVEMRAVEDRSPLDLGEVLGRRSGAFVADVFIGVPLAGGARFLNWIRSPFSSLATDIQFDAVAAQRAFQNETGILVPLHLGEISGNPDIVRRAKFLGKVPGGAEAMEAFKQRQEGALQKLQRIIIGTDTADEVQAGKQVIKSLEGKMAPAVAAEAAERTAVAKSGEAQLESLVAGATLPQRQMTSTYVGDVVRNRLVQLRDTAKSNVDALFQQFRDLGGQSATFKADDLAKAAKKIMDDLPPQFRQTEAGAELAGPSTAFASESSVLRRLNELKNAEGASYRFSDLQQMRNAVFDDMAKSEAVPGLDKRHLGQIADAITIAMEKGIDQIKDPTLKQALKTANEAYKKELVPFNKKGISEVFANEFEKGYIAPARLADSFTKGADATDRFNLIKDFLGKDSLEFNMLKRHVADSVMQQGQVLGAETIDAKTFLKNLSNFFNDKPEIATEIFGKKQAQLIDTAKVMMLASENAKLPIAEVEKLIAAGKADTSALQRLVRAQAKLDEQTSNTILDAIKRKTVTGLDVSAEDIVNRWLPKASRDEVAQFMAMLSDRPALVDDIRSIYAQKAFAKASESGKTVMDALRKEFGDEKGKLILGDKMLEDLTKYGAIQKAIGAARVSEAAGGMAGGERVSKFITDPLRQVPKALQEWVTAKIITSDKMRNWALAGKPQDPGTIMLVLSSPPFIEAVADTFGPGTTGQNVMQTLHQGLGDALKQFMGQQKADQELQRRFEATSPKIMELPKRMFGPQGGAGFVAPTNQPAQP